MIDTNLVKKEAKAKDMVEVAVVDKVGVIALVVGITMRKEKAQHEAM